MGNYILGPNGELYHHGIKGMKWGVRRYQNKDGTLTPAGKKRLSENAGKYLYYNVKDQKNHRNRNAVTGKFNTTQFNRNLGSDPSLEDLESFLDEYSSATLKDLKFKDTDDARKYVKEIFSNDKRMQDVRESEAARAMSRKTAEQELARMNDVDRAQTENIINNFKTETWGRWEDYGSRCKVNIGGEDVEIYVKSSKGNEAIDAIATTNFLKRFDIEKAKQGVIDEYYDSPYSWVNDPNSEWYVNKDDFKARIKPGYIDVRPESKTYEIWWDDDDMYGGHSFTGEGSMEDMKIRYWSLNG